MDQTVLGPGVYVFQTRTLAATCGDDERSGYVSSFVASIDGVPGSRAMTMHLHDARYWSTWDLTVAASGSVHGSSLMDGTSGPNRPNNVFDVTRDASGRFTGHGARGYDATIAGHAQHCEVTYDALMRRIDLRGLIPPPRAVTSLLESLFDARRSYSDRHEGSNEGSLSPCLGGGPDLARGLQQLL